MAKRSVDEKIEILKQTFRDRPEALAKLKAALLPRLPFRPWKDHEQVMKEIKHARGCQLVLRLLERFGTEGWVNMSEEERKQAMEEERKKVDLRGWICPARGYCEYPKDCSFRRAEVGR